MKIKPTSVRFDNAMLKRLKKEAEKRNRSVSNLIKHIISLFFKEQK